MSITTHPPAAAIARAWQRERATAAEATTRSAVLAAGRAAALVAAALPGAAVLLFSIDDQPDWFGHELEAVRGRGGELLWYGDLLADGPEATALDAAGGPATRYFDQVTCTAIGEVITDRQDLTRPHLHTGVVAAGPGGEPVALVALDVHQAIHAAGEILAPVAIDFDRLGDLLRRETAVLDPGDVPALLDALRAATGAGGPGRERRALDELRVLLREWRQYDDTALVGLIERLLMHYGWWDDDDHDNAQARRARFTDGVDPELCAYDGSNQPQKRLLTGRERDVLCRLVFDVLDGLRRGGESAARVHQAVRAFPGDLELLAEVRFVLDPRED